MVRCIMGHFLQQFLDCLSLLIRRWEVYRIDVEDIYMGEIGKKDVPSARRRGGVF